TLYRRWSPNWTAYTETAAEVKRTFAEPGRLEAALGYYWTFAATARDRDLQRFYAQKPKMPLLTFAGASDGAIVMKQFRRMEATLGPDFQLRVHQEAGHFLHREVPEWFAGKVQGFLG
ncbi:MAG: alpha/beta hydrolase, partial [Bacteroidota bacterium]